MDLKTLDENKKFCVHKQLRREWMLDGAHYWVANA